MPLKDSAGNVVTTKKQGVPQSSLAGFEPVSATIGSSGQSILLKPKQKPGVADPELARKVAEKRALNQVDKDFEAKGAGEKLNTMVGLMSAAADELNDRNLLGALKGRKTGAVRNAGEYSGLPPETQGLVDSIAGMQDNIKFQIARKIAGEKGMMSDLDVQFAGKLAPDFFAEPYTTIKTKLKLINLFMSQGSLDEKAARNYIKEMLKQTIPATSPITSKTQRFTINGKEYNIPENQVAEFKKDMGLK